MDRLKIKPAVYAIIQNGEKILLLKRFNSGWMDGRYTLPSGHIDQRESPTGAVIREIKEETSVAVEKENLELVHVMYEKDAYIDFYFKVTSYSGEITHAEPERSSEILWEKDIKGNKNIIEKVKLSLLSYKSGIPFSEIDRSEGN